MATIIYRTQYGTSFVTYGHSTTQTVTFPLLTIANIQKKISGKRVRLVIRSNAPSYMNVPDKLGYEYDNITYPVHSDPEDLITKIFAENALVDNVLQFSSLEGQDVFSKPSGQDNVVVFVNGAAQNSDSDYTYTNFTTITFMAPLKSGDEVIILIINKIL
jgi:hypothetical protein